VSTLLTIDADATAVIAALDRLGPVAASYVKAAAKETADRIATEAGGRIARRTGHTAEGITVEETRNGQGYVVFVKNPETPGLPLWIEFGTKFHTARPFLFASARLEEGPHDRRVREAINAAIHDTGLGD
jgi:hypothetical protein